MATNEAGQQRIDEQQKIREQMGQIKYKILVLSGKGGVGKSTVAANLATSLAARGRKVGLLDVDIHGPSIPQLLGVSATPTELTSMNNAGAPLTPVSAGPNLKVMSTAFLLESRDTAVIWRGPMKYNVIKQFLKDVAWGDLDYLIIDSPPGTGDEPLSVVQLLETSTGAIIVTTPQDLAVSDVRRCVTFCRQLALPVLGVIENMSGFICPKCGEQTDIFKAGGGQSMAKDMDIPCLACVPIEPRLVVAGDSGVPYLERFANTETARRFDAAVEAIVATVEKEACDNKPIERAKHVRIAIPIVGNTLSAHFGHCENFALLDANIESKTITATEILEAPSHEPGLLPRWLAEKGANMIIAGGMGGRAQELFQQQNITVVTGAPSDTPEAIVHAYLQGALETGDNVCDH